MKHLFSIILAIAVVFSGNSQKREYYDPLSWGDNRPEFDVDTSGVFIAVEARGELIGVKERRGSAKEWWGIAWNYVDDANCCMARIGVRNTDFGDLTDSRVLDLTVVERRNGEEDVKHVTTLERGVSLQKGANSLAVEWDRGRMKLFVGAKEPELVMDVEYPKPVQPQCAILYSGRFKLLSLVTESEENKPRLLATSYSKAMLDDRFAASVDPIEGYWSYLDRETDDARARLGGRYDLAIVREGDEYLLLYVGGADVNSSNWKPMMVKGRMTPTPFKSHYDLTWYDSMMVPMDDDTFSMVDDEMILTLKFPVYRSQLRFYKR